MSRPCQHAWVYEQQEILDKDNRVIEQNSRHHCWACGATSDEAPPGTLFHRYLQAAGMLQQNIKGAT